MTLPPPATEAGIYLAAIHDVLCDIRSALVGGGQEQDPTTGPVELTEPATPTAPATKRTRTRIRG